MAKKWYVIHTYSGYEAKVRDALQQRVKQYSLEDKFGEILIRARQSPSSALVGRRAFGRSSACPATFSLKWR
jgi:transcription antitermination factor NusG